ncbi:cupin domain-containing protein [Sphingobium yanoikuyae]|jgi:mannose-6-phosphate isomerase-like protein (cupin superfamily)|uniref:Cupin domain-containing protein n=1 Tax=Sphingobium yanoikuyae TaxID=13690 RepID=A0A085K0W5_SPHYA|nr:cupin domain-containing protein [Sphingobium yanoikuyae]AYO76792.1 cupin domain-containing protein [Sphingobium yanoikuyae]KFD26361.1 cupin [Sphingobium yanoikuyae]KZC77564.1 cupin [Sphingobium yanoikuyae]MDV3481897.1 cupin domain-containing protein [Sphingobium yanoikuyae]
MGASGMAGWDGRIVGAGMTILLLPLLLAAAPGASSDTAIAPIDRGNAEHYVWGGSNDGWHLVKRDEMSVIQERIVPGGAEVRHYHQRARQFFYVLSGELTLEAGGVTHVLKAGQGLEVPPGVPHRAQNSSSAPVDFLVNSTPKSHGDRIDAPAEK